MKKGMAWIYVYILSLFLMLTACSSDIGETEFETVFPNKTIETTIEPTTVPTLATEAPSVLSATLQPEVSFDISSVPAYCGKSYVVVNNNIPYFTEADYSTTSFETYSPLDSLGRCGVALANVGIDLMPTEERDSIGSVKPSGWHTIRYENVDGKYLYNICKEHCMFILHLA